VGVHRVLGMVQAAPTPVPSPRRGRGGAWGLWCAEVVGERLGWVADASGGDIWGHEMVWGFGGGGGVRTW
jgi:hypothetical protein